MAQQERFYQKVIDRTPYGACYVVATFTVVLSIILMVGIWQAGRYVHRFGVFGFLKETGTSALNQSSDQANKVIDEAKKQAGQTASDAVQSAADEAKKQADQAVQNELDKQKASLEATTKAKLESLKSPLSTP